MELLLFAPVELVRCMQLFPTISLCRDFDEHSEVRVLSYLSDVVQHAFGHEFFQRASECHRTKPLWTELIAPPYAHLLVTLPEGVG